MCMCEGDHVKQQMQHCLTSGSSDSASSKASTGYMYVCVSSCAQHMFKKKVEVLVLCNDTCISLQSGLWALYSFRGKPCCALWRCAVRCDVSRLPVKCLWQLSKRDDTCSAWAGASDSCSDKMCMLSKINVNMAALFSRVLFARAHTRQTQDTWNMHLHMHSSISFVVFDDDCNF